MEAITQFSNTLIQALQTLSPSLDMVFVILSFLGQLEFYLVALPLIYWTVNERVGLRGLIVIAATELATGSLKLFFRQPRPYWLGSAEALAEEASYALPSGHSSGSAAFWGYLASQYKQRNGYIVAGVIIFLVGLSRMYLGVHSLLDVVTGWALGLGIVFAAVRLENPLRQFFKTLSLAQKVVTALAGGLVLSMVGVLFHALVSGTQDPAAWASFATEARSLDFAFTDGGAIGGGLAGYFLMRAYANFDASLGTVQQKIIRFLIGIVVLVGLWYGLGQLFSPVEETNPALGYALRFLRYGVIGLWGFFFAPMVFLRFGLAQSPKS